MTFFAIGHFSKFVPPDSVRIGHKVDKKVEGLCVLTVRRLDNATVVIALNVYNYEIELNINGSNTYLTLQISPHSVQSYICW